MDTPDFVSDIFRAPPRNSGTKCHTAVTSAIVLNDDLGSRAV